VNSNGAVTWESKLVVASMEKEKRVGDGRWEEAISESLMAPQLGRWGITIQESTQRCSSLF